MKQTQTPFATRLSGNSRETELRICNIVRWKKKRPPLWLLTMVTVLALGCGGLVSCQKNVEPEPPADVSAPEVLPAQSVSEPAKQEQEPKVYEEELTGLTLDGQGEEDDRVFVSARIPPDYEDCEVSLRVDLGDGGQLTKTWKDGLIPTLLSARFQGLDRDCVVLELHYFTSTYMAADTYVFTIEQGELQQLMKFEGISGAYVERRTDGDVLRVPKLVNKWHMPEWHTVSWVGDELIAREDGFFTDAISLESYRTDPTDALVKTELTLSLRGYAHEDSLYYDQVQVKNGDTLFQTIQHKEYLPQKFQDLGFLAFSPYRKTVQVMDINFDGYLDFGLLCDNTRNEYQAWFIWNQETKRFEFIGYLGAELTANETVRQLEEVVWDQDYGHTITNYYVVNGGRLIHLLAPDGRAKTTAASQALEAVLAGERSAYYVDYAEDRYVVRTPPSTQTDELVFVSEHFSVVDLDRDGTAEVVLWLTLEGNPYCGFDILRYENGAVRCYSQVYRGFRDLKQDGTFVFSSGHNDNGFGRIRAFREDGIETEKITWCEPADNPFGVAFYAEGGFSSREGFNQSFFRRNGEPNVAWYSVTDENIELLAGLMSAAVK